MTKYNIIDLFEQEDWANRLLLSDLESTLLYLQKRGFDMLILESLLADLAGHFERSAVNDKSETNIQRIPLYYQH